MSRMVAEWRDAFDATVASWRNALTSLVANNIAAGLTVALVALPLNMALAIACGLPASVGLVTGAVAGLIGAAVGGSKLQITGPEVALAPVTFTILSKHGLEGLLAVTVVAGLLQIAFGLVRIGRLVHAIPVPVIAGFLAAVAVMVFDSQLPVLIGITDEARFVTDFRPAHVHAVSIPTVAIGLATVSLLVVVPRLTRRVPGPLVALAAAMGMVAWFGLPTAMVDGIDGSFPSPAWPSLSAVPVGELFAEAVALAMIASIDSLLCAVSVDARTGSRTRTDQELVAQGLANIGSACFGGMPVAAAIVRSAAAIEAGATSRLAPVAQSLVLALVVVVFAPMVEHIPLVALSGILLVVGVKLIDLDLVRHLWRVGRFEVAVLVATGVGILLTDFVFGVLIGVLAALAEFAYRQRALMRTEPVVVEDIDGVHLVRVEGPLFFGSQAKVDRLLDGVGRGGVVVVDLSAVPTLDSSGASALARALERILREDNDLWLSALSESARRWLAPLLDSGRWHVHLVPSVAVALEQLLHEGADRGATP